MQIGNHVASGTRRVDLVLRAGDPEVSLGSFAVGVMKLGSCAVTSAASTVCLGSGTCARLPPLNSNWKDTWFPRKIEIEGWSGP